MMAQGLRALGGLAWIAVSFGLGACATSNDAPLPMTTANGSVNIREAGAGKAADFAGPGCDSVQRTVLVGEVDDGFGMSVAVCVSEHAADDHAGIQVRYSGEGGGRTVSCIASACNGIIDFTHYRRFRFTVITLEWRDDNGVHRLVETYDAQAADQPPSHSLTHAWQPSVGEPGDPEVSMYPVHTPNQPLSLLELERYLGGDR